VTVVAVKPRWHTAPRCFPPAPSIVTHCWSRSGCYPKSIWPSTWVHVGVAAISRPSTTGPGAASIAWLHVCGNARQIHPIVDDVSREGETVGAAVAKALDIETSPIQE